LKEKDMNKNRGSTRRKLAGCTFALAVVVLFHNTHVQAQPQESPKQTPEVQQLRQRQQKLEQLVLNRKGQMDAIEETNKKSQTPAIVEETCSESSTPAVPATPEKSQDNNGKGESTFRSIILQCRHGLKRNT